MRGAWHRVALWSITLICVGGPGTTPPVAAGPGDASPQARRVIAIGDVQGSLGSLRTILRQAALTDDADRWVGGRSVAVFTGDVLDKGVAVREVIDLLMQLQAEAEEAEGKVFVLLGNHEAMNLLGELGDVRWEVYESFAGDASEQRRQQAWSEHVALHARRAEATGQAPTEDPEARQLWLDTHPPGWLEYVEAMSPEGRYGRWLRTLPAAVQVGETLFMHAGASPDLEGLGLGEINRRIADEIERFDRLRAIMIEAEMALPWYSARDLAAIVVDEVNFLSRLQGRRDARQRARVARAHELQELGRWGTWDLVRQDGPIWFRGPSTWTDGEGATLVSRMLDPLHVRRLVIGHGADGEGRVLARFEGRVLLISTGMSDEPWSTRQPAAVEIVGSSVAIIDPAGRHDLS